MDENFSAGQAGAGTKDAFSRISRLEAETMCVSLLSLSLLSLVCQLCIVVLLITLRGLNVDKHKTRLLKSLTIIMQHFSDYSH